MTALGTTQYLYGNLSNPFQVTASRAPDNVLTVYYYDDFGALYALERGGQRYYVAPELRHLAIRQHAQLSDISEQT